ncbi:MAG: hypothetical protein COV35_07735 [Alphaproteobacteria bacterium CG11_big_fil_rev_8_21_14_0_20_39_49]|nr:MAG: hypothetical protein COV35_07735 [Alphaproteobacteria bacterium CG11_big_fil_rev_8_21_14_0_20_39_49]
MEPSLLLFTVLTGITLLVLVAGVLVMAKGGEFNKKHGNKLMVARVALQLFAVLLLGGLYLFAK